MKRWLSMLVLLPAVLLVQAPPAQAAARVSVDGGGQGPVIDRTYSTQLTVRGSAFQSIRGGHGGIYVWFGTVSPGWQPSKGGRSGEDYAYVPDTEDKSNQGFQQFVAFPGSDTGDSAAATMGADGSWTVRLTVPGPSFQAVGRNGSVRTVDCRKVTCGVITVGAHGVRNANNETFTPVRVGDLHGGEQPGATPAPDQPATGTEPDVATQPSAPAAAAAPAQRRRAARGPSRFEVDRAAAAPGRAVSWTADRLTPGRQFTVVLDDGLSASGPHVAGLDGRASGVIQLPADLRAGTHELRLYGAGKAATVRFGTSAAETPSRRSEQVARATPATVVAVGSGVVFCAALLVLVRRVVRRRHA